MYTVFAIISGACMTIFLFLFVAGCCIINGRESDAEENRIRKEEERK